MKLDRVIIKTADYRKSFEFYHEILGLRMKSSWQRPDNWGALFYCGEILLEIVWHPDEHDSDPICYPIELQLQVSNVDALFNRLRSQDGLSISQLTDEPWGSRIFSLYDPDRVKIIFAQPI